MAKCDLCKEKAVFLDPNFCRQHFIDFFEKKVRDTIKNFSLIDKKDKVVVGASGGKDSLSLLYLLHKLGYNVSALAVDEGIRGYRDKTLDILSDFCKKNNIPLNIVSFKESFKHSLDSILKNHDYKPCTVCGVFRRNLLHVHAKDFDVLATGHNMDDEAQAVLMNLIKGNISIMNRLGPVSGQQQRKAFTKRVKPFYFCSEKEVMVYSFLNKLTSDFTECPNVEHAFRLRVRDMLNDYEVNQPGTKKHIIEWFLNYKKTIPKTTTPINVCTHCGEPSAQTVCNTCNFMLKITA